MSRFDFQAVAQSPNPVRNVPHLLTFDERAGGAASELNPKKEGRRATSAQEVLSRIACGSNLFPDGRDYSTRRVGSRNSLLPKKNGPLHDSPTLPSSGMQTMSRGKPGNAPLVDAAKTPASRSLRVIARAIPD